MYPKTAHVIVLVFFIKLCNGDEGFYNIAHMTNTPRTVEWAVGRGANGVEIDLTFDSGTGNALFFRHSARGEMCDCSCQDLYLDLPCTFFPNNICCRLRDEVPGFPTCQAQSSISTLLSTIATKSAIAMVIIDSKIERERMTDEAMGNAGRSVVEALTAYLFGGGYGGKVIIGSPELDTLPYLASAVDAVRGLPYEPRVYFTVDGETNNIVNTLRSLHTLPTRNIVYGTGITSCVPSFLISRSTMELAVVNKARDVTGLTYLWTIDRRSTILKNLPYVQGVVSNEPGLVSEILAEKGIKKATQSSTIPQAISSDVITETVSLSCDCEYHPGGCVVNRAAPQGMACNCEYGPIILWTCRGTLAQCSDPDSIYCKYPDTSIYSCLQGGGDCNGYRAAVCDCDYHPSGCRISQVPPRNTACRCVYRGPWTCGGEIVRCLDANSQYCTNPDSSVNTCIQGGGDCNGYQTAACDCDYHPGGCAISRAAPRNTACKCVYKSFWTCGGEIVRCSDFNSQYCTNPDTSVQSCFQGGGDCEGYATATCDCNYHPGGCTISRAPPRDTACRCNYVQFWTCSGSIVYCNDVNNIYCRNPDTSLNTCLLGGGDCGGYR